VPNYFVVVRLIIRIKLLWLLGSASETKGIRIQVVVQNTRLVTVCIRRTSFFQAAKPVLVIEWIFIQWENMLLLLCRHFIKMFLMFFEGLKYERILKVDAVYDLFFLYLIRPRFNLVKGGIYLLFLFIFKFKIFFLDLYSRLLGLLLLGFR
jgi:hypothetical protein